MLASRPGRNVLRQFDFTASSDCSRACGAVQVRRQLVVQVDSLLLLTFCGSARMASNCRLVLLSFVLCHLL